MLSDVCLTSVAYIRSAGGVCGRPAGWRVLADRARLGPAQGCRCALPLHAWAGAYRGGHPPTACYYYYYHYYYYYKQCNGFSFGVHCADEGDRIPPLKGYGQALKQTVFLVSLWRVSQSPELAQWSCARCLHGSYYYYLRQRSYVF